MQQFCRGVCSSKGKEKAGLTKQQNCSDMTCLCYIIFPAACKTTKKENWIDISVTSEFWGPFTLPQRNLQTEVLLWNVHQLSSFCTTPEEFENATIKGHFGFVFDENSGREITWLLWRHRFQLLRFQNVFSFVYTKTQSQRFQIPPEWKAFTKSSVFVTN